METVKIYEIPDCKMVSSGTGIFGEEKFIYFGNWLSSLPPQYENWMNIPMNCHSIKSRLQMTAV